MKRGSPDGVRSSGGEISSCRAGSTGGKLLFSSDVGFSDSALTMTVSRVQEKGQERALCSGDLHRLQRRHSGLSEAR